MLHAGREPTSAPAVEGAGGLGEAGCRAIGSLHCLPDPVRSLQLKAFPAIRPALKLCAAFGASAGQQGWCKGPRAGSSAITSPALSPFWHSHPSKTSLPSTLQVHLLRVRGAAVRGAVEPCLPAIETAPDQQRAGTPPLAPQSPRSGPAAPPLPQARRRTSSLDDRHHRTNHAPLGENRPRPGGARWW